MDTVSHARRTEIMRLVKSKDTDIERALREALKKEKLRFRTNVATLPGKPDIVFSKQKLAIFMDSCFWHGCKKHCRLPSTNRSYWRNKIEKNKKRDMAVSKKLKSIGWRTIRIWEHTITKGPAQTAQKIEKALK